MLRYLLSAMVGLACGTLSAAMPPNIVLIVSDDQGYQDLGILNPEIQTPNLDRLAREGVRLTNFYVAWPACTPSRGSILTGRYPQRNGLYDMFRNEAPDYGHLYTPDEYAVTFERVAGLDEREILISQVLKQAGYATGVFGKWDSGMQRRFLPLQRGWDDFYGFVNTGIDYFTHERYGVPSMYRGNQPTVEDRGAYCTDLFEREALRFLRRHRDRPVFLYVPFNAPHGASSLDPAVRSAPQAPEETKRLYPELVREAGLMTRMKNGQEEKVLNAASKKLEYLASVTHMDRSIGRILDELEASGRAENTLVLFFSDNGGSGAASNVPLRGRKSQTFEGGLRVCALARYPGKIPAGSVCDEFLTALEVFPTFTKLAGATNPPGVKLDGFDALSVLAGREKSPRQEMFWKRRDWEAARIGDWKWVRHGDQQFVFNLAEDMGERQNLAKSRPEKLAELTGRFRAWQAEMEAAEPRGPFRDY